MGQQYLFWFAQVHDDFRIPELQSVAEIHGFDLHIPQDLDASRPFCILELDHEEHARLLARRCILIRCGSVIISVLTCIGGAPRASSPATATMVMLHRRHIVQIHRDGVQSHDTTSSPTRSGGKFFIYGLPWQDRYEKSRDHHDLLRRISR